MDLNVKELEVIENKIDTIRNKDEDKDEDKDKDDCDHLWVDDLIDLTPDASRYVTYCGNCFVTKK